MVARRSVHKRHHVGIRDFRAHLRRWLAEVARGCEVVITDRGKPIAKVVSDQAEDGLQKLIEAGIVRPPLDRKRPADQFPRIPVKGSVTEILLEQRRRRPW